MAAAFGRRRWQEPACPGSDEPGRSAHGLPGRPGVLANTPGSYEAPDCGWSHPSRNYSRASGRAHRPREAASSTGYATPSRCSGGRDGRSAGTVRLPRTGRRPVDRRWRNREWGSFTDPGSTARLGRRRTRAEGCLARRSVRGGPPEFDKADCRERYAVQCAINRLKGHRGTTMSRPATANRSSTTK